MKHDNIPQGTANVPVTSQTTMLLAYSSVFIQAYVSWSRQQRPFCLGFHENIPLWDHILRKHLT